MLRNYQKSSKFKKVIIRINTNTCANSWRIQIYRIFEGHKKIINFLPLVYKRRERSLFNILDAKDSHQLSSFSTGNNEEHFHSSWIGEYVTRGRMFPPRMDLRLVRYSQGVSSPSFSTPRGVASLISDLVAGAATCHSGARPLFIERNS